MAFPPGSKVLQSTVFVKCRGNEAQADNACEAIHAWHGFTGATPVDLKK
jgi:hypothetical protein